MLNLGRGISEYEDPKVIPFLWEEPSDYERIFEDDFYVISGRKGSGKSTIVEYTELTQSDGKIVIVFRPSEEEFLFDQVKEFSASNSEDYHSARQTLARLFEYLIYVIAMRKHISGKENTPLVGNDSIIYTFLAQNNLIEGSVIKRSLDQIAEITQDYKKINRLFSLLQKAKCPTYQTARDAFFEKIKENKQSYLVFIDDIDGFGFEYKPQNVALLDSLIILTLNVNTHCVRKGISFRIIITPPTEILDNARFWNRDKIISKTAFIRWKKIEKIENLVNRRIGAELGLYQRKKQRGEKSKFSADSIKTWDRIFPMTIANRISTKEKTLNYIVRHTFYTPRGVLGICQAALEHMRELNYSLETLNQASESDWIDAIQGACEEKSNDYAKNIIDIYELIFPGIENLLSKFEGRPNIWDRNTFRDFLKDVSSDIVKSADMEKYLSPEQIVNVLFSMGFMGYAFPNLNSPPTGTSFELFFSYVRWTSRSGWELAMISPVFYDSIRIQPVESIIIEPHSNLVLSQSKLKHVRSYSARLNTFTS